LGASRFKNPSIIAAALKPARWSRVAGASELSPPEDVPVGPPSFQWLVWLSQGAASKVRLHTPAALALTGIKTEDHAIVRLTSCMNNFVFKCPLTGMNVQHRLADEPVPGDQRCTYETVLCQACGRLHFINRSSRKLLGGKGGEEEKEE
jgi:hypothetical protein